MNNIAVFLDRDGMIAPNVNYCGRVEDFNIFSLTPEAIKLLNENGFKVFLTTSQSGIARDYFSENTPAGIRNKLEIELTRYEAFFDAIYYYPHHEDDGCNCHKPKTALFNQAANEFDIGFAQSFMIGKVQTDMDAGRAVGCQTVLVTKGPKRGNNIVDAADYTASNLIEAAQRIKRHLII